jgi:uncharacterized protein (TIGR04141 family)
METHGRPDAVSRHRDGWTSMLTRIVAPKKLPERGIGTGGSHHLGTDMADLSCYRVRPELCTGDCDAYETVLDLPATGIEVHGPSTGPGFEVMAYVANSTPSRTSWSGFIESGFMDLQLGFSLAPSALLIVRLNRTRPKTAADGAMFAFPFGYAGRFYLRPESYVRGYGLRAALNIIYPRSGDDTARLRAMDAKRRGPTTVRARVQASHQTDFETFDINRYRDVVSKATGVPADRATWGSRISGGDALNLQAAITFEELGTLCRKIEAAHDQNDYQEKFDWIDHIQAITDPHLKERLEAAVIDHLKADTAISFELAPPEIVDWDHVAAFRYHFDRPQGKAHNPVHHPDIHLEDYQAGLRRLGRLDSLDLDYLKAGNITALDTDGTKSHVWSVWRCLVGELDLDGQVFILDEGEFFQVRRDYLDELDATIAGIPLSDLPLPSSGANTTEAAYNERAAASSPSLVLLDKRLVRISSRTTPVEICDLLSIDRQLIHIKRHLGSKDLSHHFAQGLVSAELLQNNPEFRREAATKVAEAAEDTPGFEFLESDAFRPSEFEVVYGVIEKWNGRSIEALPFFSKVNLREVAGNLRARGFRVAFATIDTRAA